VIAAPADSGPGLDANVSTLFREFDLLDRPRAAAAAGFDAIECWWPFDGPEPDDRSYDRFVTAVREAGVALVAVNLDGGDLAAGDRGILSHPEHQARFDVGLAVAVQLVADLQVPVVHGLYGNRLLGLDARDQGRVAAANLAAVSAAVAPHGARVVIEALNPWENPLYPLTRGADIRGVLDRIARDYAQQVWWLYDCYHAQRTEGELIATISHWAHRFGHFQLADAPGRGEPGTGEIAVDRVLEALAASGYQGHVGLEFLPSTDTSHSLRDLPRWETALRAGVPVGAHEEEG
jgi:hydroxypyruvate isomerase